MSQTKPRLVFFQSRYDENLPKFLLMHMQAHVKCLSHFFDVTVIHHDCDYQEVCDTYEPDLTLFESGVTASRQKVKIQNARAYPHVPRLGLHNSDPFCNARAGFLSDMDDWGIETFFAISTTAAEHTPEIADQVFVWPNCIDPAIYRDYGEWKSIPVLFTGHSGAMYPWRNQVLKLVSEHYPSLVCPHPGYDPNSVATQVLSGERYARTINASVVVPACGTIAREVVRKHFEIPACRSLLVTERSAALEAAGFVDMQNCVFADADDVLEKVGHLFRHQDELQLITEAGYELAHASHTLHQRDQIYQWYALHKNLRPHERIVQGNPFGQLSVVDSSSGIRSAHVSGGGLHLGLLHEGDVMLRTGKYEEAEAVYLKCLSYMRWMPEAKLGVALSRLNRGDANTARSWIFNQVQFILGEYGAADPDPVEWAYYIVSLLCLGRLDEAGRCGRQFAWLRHPELDRVRWAAAVLQDAKPESSLVGDRARRRASVHRLGSEGPGEWLVRVGHILRACGRNDFADTLRRHQEALAHFEHARESVTEQSPQGLVGGSNPRAPIAGARGNSRLFKRRLRNRKAAKVLKGLFARTLHRLEKRYGYFLPYHLSEIRRDEFFSQLQQITRVEDIRTALLVGCGSSGGHIEALFEGMRASSAKPNVYCIDAITPPFRRFEKAFAGRVKCFGISSSSPEEFLKGVDDAVMYIGNELGVGLDALLMDGSTLKRHDFKAAALQMALLQAKLVVLDGINNLANFENHERLLNDPNYVLAAHNPALRNGYAIFRRTTVTSPVTEGWSKGRLGRPRMLSALLTAPPSTPMM